MDATALVVTSGDATGLGCASKRRRLLSAWGGTQVGGRCPWGNADPGATLEGTDHGRRFVMSAKSDQAVRGQEFAAPTQVSGDWKNVMTNADVGEAARHHL